MNFQDNKKVSSSELIKELELTLRDRRKHHRDYKKLNAAAKQKLEHEWSIDFLKSGGVVFAGGKLINGEVKES
jgi:hypothetical protein